MRIGHGARELSRGPRASLATLYRGLANGLTLGRFVVPVPFIYLMLETHRGASGSPGGLLFALYLVTASSDLLDGYFARKAGAGSAKWGRLDALADMLFNTSSLLAAAWLGLVGYWVPLGVMALAAQFLYRNRTPRPERRPRLLEDLPGKAAGVVYYLLVGAVALGLWLDGGWWNVWIHRAGNAVFVYTALVFAGNLCRSAEKRSNEWRL